MKSALAGVGERSEYGAGVQYQPGYAIRYVPVKKRRTGKLAK
jgi:hypothetical protein